MDILIGIWSSIQLWIYSGCGILSLLAVYGYLAGSGFERRIPLAAALLALNLTYAITSTSWLLLRAFSVATYSAVPLLCLVVSPTAASICRSIARRILQNLNFTEYKIAFFHPPALHIDTEVEGLFVVRGLTLHLSSLTVEASGVEVAVQILDKLQLALYVDQVTIHLSRLIEIGAVYGTLKDEDSKSIFRDLSNDAEQKSPPSRKVASKGRVPRGDSEAEQQYNDVRKDIFDSSPVNTSRKEVEKSQISSDNRELNNAEMRAAMCGKLVGSPAVPHTPPNSVRVTTLQNLLPRWLARFLARMPFLLRLLLLPLSYLHPIVISSITVAGPGYWLAEMLQDRILDYYIQDTDEGKELSERIKTYVQEAMFTFDTYDLSALGQVPVRTMHDIRAELRGATGTVFRAAPDTVGSLMEFAGSDLEFTIPSYLMPHHEHLVPPPPKGRFDHQEKQEKGIEENIEDRQSGNDEAQINMRIHGSLPATIDHSLMEFFVDLVNASKVLEMETNNESNNAQETEQTSEDGQDAKQEKGSLKERAKDVLREHVKDRGKKLAMRGLGDQQSQWAKEMITTLASHGERMHGDVGYSGSIPVVLQDYRGPEDRLPKLWP